MSKSTTKTNSSKSKKQKRKQKSESAITIKSNLKNVQETQLQINTMGSSTKKEPQLDLVQNFPNLESKTKKSKSLILGSATCSKKNVQKTRKRTTVWTKFPANGETAPKVQKPKQTSVYKQGISFSDVLFSAGPSSTVKIKSVSITTENLQETQELPSLALITNFPTPDEMVFGNPKAKLKRGKPLSGSHLCHDKVNKTPVVKTIEPVETKTKIQLVPAIEEKVKVMESPVGETGKKTLETLKNEPLPENFETDALLKVKSTNKLDLPCLIDAPSSSDENANVSEPSESDSESNFETSKFKSLKVSLLKPQSLKIAETPKNVSLNNSGSETANLLEFPFKSDETSKNVELPNLISPDVSLNKPETETANLLKLLFKSDETFKKVDLVSPNVSLPKLDAETFYNLIQLPFKQDETPKNVQLPNLVSPNVSLPKLDAEAFYNFLQLPLNSDETPMTYNAPEPEYQVPRQNENPPDILFGIPWWNYAGPINGPEPTNVELSNIDSTNVSLPNIDAETFYKLLQLPLKSDETPKSVEPLNLTSQNVSLPKLDAETFYKLLQLPLNSDETPKQEEPIKYSIPEPEYRVPRQNEKPADTLFGIPWWNFTDPFEGPEIFPHHTRQFTDEVYLYAEDLALLALKLAQGK